MIGLLPMSLWIVIVLILLAKSFVFLLFFLLFFCFLFFFLFFLFFVVFFCFFVFFFSAISFSFFFFFLFDDIYSPFLFSCSLLKEGVFKPCEMKKSHGGFVDKALPYRFAWHDLESRFQIIKEVFSFFKAFLFFFSLSSFLLFPLSFSFFTFSSFLLFFLPFIFL